MRRPVAAASVGLRPAVVDSADLRRQGPPQGEGASALRLPREVSVDRLRAVWAANTVRLRRHKVVEATVRLRVVDLRRVAGTADLRVLRRPAVTAARLRKISISR